MITLLPYEYQNAIEINDIPLYNDIKTFYIDSTCFQRISCRHSMYFILNITQIKLLHELLGIKLPKHFQNAMIINDSNNDNTSSDIDTNSSITNTKKCCCIC